MAKSTSRLGRGLGSLIAGGTGTPADTLDSVVPAPTGTSVNGTVNANGIGGSTQIPTIPGKDVLTKPEPVGERILEVPVGDLRPNPHQPRKALDPVKVKELAASIKTEGLLQPIVTRSTEDGYEIIAGERRWRAHQQLGRETILVRVVDATDLSSATISLVENLQREGLNPLEEALGYASLVNDFNLTQAQVAHRVGKSRTYVTNMMRLLQLDEDLRNLLTSGKLSVGHAKALLGVEDETLRSELAGQAMREGWTVRQCEEAVEALRSGSTSITSRRTGSSRLAPVFRQITDQVGSRLGVQARVTANGAGKGKLIIPFEDEDDFRRIASALGV